MAVRIAAVSDDLSSDFAEAADIAVGAGLAGLAVRHVGGVNVRDLDDDEVRLVRRSADDRGLAVEAVSSPLGRDVSLDDPDDATVALLDRMIRLADLLGTPLVRVFAPWIHGKDPLPEWWERPDQEEVRARVAERMARYAERAERAGVTLMLELEGASHVGQVSEAAAVLDDVRSPALALCWDVCNGWWSGEEPWEHGWPIARRLPLVDVQAKDVRSGPDGRPRFEQVVLGDGDIRYDLILPALLQQGYDGWFTAERVYHPRKPEHEPRLRADILADLARLHALLGT